jgi:hypothetical protein
MPADRRLVAAWITATAAYMAVTLAYLWPVVTHLSSAWPHDPLDSALSGAILFWDAHAIPLTSVWANAPMYWPVHGALTFSEHLLGISLLTTPLQWSGASVLTAYNVAFLFTFPLAALAAHALAYTFVKRHDIAALGGCIFGFNPYRVAQLAHLQVLWAFGMPVAMLALHRFVEVRHRRWLLVFGAALLLQSAANGYYMLYFPVLIALWLLWFARERTVIVPVLVAWMLASLPLAPVLWVYARHHTALGLSRGLTEIESFSADVMSIAIASPDLIVWRGLSRWTKPEGALFPGAVALLLIAAAVVIALRYAPVRPERDPGWARAARAAATAIGGIFLLAVASLGVVGAWTWNIGSTTVVSVSAIDKPLALAMAFMSAVAISSPTFRSVWKRRSTFGFYVFAAAVMLVLSLGPRPALAGSPVLFRAPYAWLMELPGFSEVRVPARFGMLFVLCVAIAAALAFARLTAAMAPARRRLLVSIAVVLVLIEGWPRVTMAEPAAPIAALTDLAPAAPVLELPLGITERDVAALYRSIGHGHPIVNGYSGYDPPHYQILKTGLRFDDRAVIDELARDHALIVAVDHREQFARWTKVVGAYPVIADEGDWRLYRVPAGSRPLPVDGPRLHVESVTANFRNDAAGQMLDGDIKTAWSTGRIQAGGEEVIIDLGRSEDLSAVRLTVGPFTLDFPRALSVDCSADAREWNPCWRGSAIALALRASLDDPLIGSLQIPVLVNATRYVRLRQTAADPVNGWAIAELSVFGR